MFCFNSKFRFLAIFFTVLLALSCFPENNRLAVNQTGSPSMEQIEKILTFAMIAEPASLDPLTSTDFPAALIQLQIFSGLFRLAEDLSVQPMLAQDYRNVDDLTWEFTLHQGVKFHNGEELTAEDVVFSLNRAFNAAISKEHFKYCESVEQLDRYRLRIVTSKPFATLLNKLTSSMGLIYSKKQFVEQGEEAFAQNPLGTGPFMFVNRVSGDRVNLAAFADYFKGAPKIDKLVIRIIPEAPAMTIALETNEIDASNWISANDIARIEASPEHEAQIIDSTALMYMGFNTTKAPFNDPIVRKAVSMAMNRIDIVEVATEGYAKPARGFLPDGFAGADDFASLYYNPDAAEKLLAESGMKDFSFTVSINDTKERRDIAQIVQANLKDIGVNMEIDVYEWASYLSMLRSGEFDAFIIGRYGSDDSDGKTELFRSTDVENGVVGSNYMRYKNDTIDQLLETGATTIDRQKMTHTYLEANTLLAEKLPIAPIYWFAFNLCHNKRIKNLTVHRAGYYYIFDQVDIQLD